MTNEADIEKEIKEKGLTAPRLTPKLIDEKIKDVKYHVFPLTQTTVCMIVLQNGFSVLGHSACASRENYDKEIGEKIAFDNARSQIWQLEGYLLKEKLYIDSQTS